MPKIQYKEINFRGKSLELINLVNQVINEYKNQGYELTLIDYEDIKDKLPDNGGQIGQVQDTLDSIVPDDEGGIDE